MKRILITGSGSYIGTSVEKWLKQEKFAGKYQVDTVDMRGEQWKQKDFSDYDAVFHVAGIAHQKETKKNAYLYYKVNRDLAVETARKAKTEGVRQFIFLSSMSVYGLDTGIITESTIPIPKTNYGKSKLQAEQLLKKLESIDFKMIIIRPPMIYGENCKGNYQVLRKIALKTPVFPDFPNQRSMIYIENFCDFVQNLFDLEQGGIYFPQNREYVKTSEIVSKIAREHNKKVVLIRGLNWSIFLLGLFPGKIRKMVNKAFGTLVYKMPQDRLCGLFDFNESIYRTELKWKTE